MMTLDRSIELLTNARWWLKGFFAGTSSDREDPVYALTCQLDDVREHLARLADGKVRTLIPGMVTTVDGRGLKTAVDRHDGGLVIITYAELEKLVDGILRKPSHEDRLLARDTARQIMREFKAEGDFYLAECDEIPF